MQFSLLRFICSQFIGEWLQNKGDYVGLYFEKQLSGAFKYIEASLDKLL